MKIKKVFEIRSATDLSNTELEEYRKNKFDVSSHIEYQLWREILSYTTPQYHRLTTEYSIDACLNYYKDNIEEYKNQKIILTSIKTESKLLDLDLLLNSEKYNL